MAEDTEVGRRDRVGQEEIRPVTGHLPYMGASSRYIHKTTCTTEFKYSRFIFADHAPS